MIRCAKNVINTKELADIIADTLIEAMGKSPYAHQYYKLIDERDTLAAQIKNPHTPFYKMISLETKLISVKRHIFSLKESIGDSIDSVIPRINNIIKESRMFNNIPPPEILAKKTILGNILTYYQPDDNVIVISKDLVSNPQYDIADKLAHELIHARQYNYDKYGMGNAFKKFLRSKDILRGPNFEDKKTEEINKISDINYRNYINNPHERQAFLIDIIGELEQFDFVPLSNMRQFELFVRQSNIWEEHTKKWYPEVKRQMIVSLYNYYVKQEERKKEKLIHDILSDFKIKNVHPDTYGEFAKMLEEDSAWKEWCHYREPDVKNQMKRKIFQAQKKFN